MIFWFFGFPGVGKDYCANLFAELNNIPYFDADNFLTDKERSLLKTGQFTKENRLIKLRRIATYLEEQLKTTPHLVIGDSLPDNASRKMLADRFLERIVFIHVIAPTNIHHKRISERKNHFFTADLLTDWVKKHWEESIEIPHISLNNDSKDSKKLISKLKTLTNQYIKV